MLIWILGCDGLLGRSMQICLKNEQIPFVATNRQAADITQFENLKKFTEEHKPTHIINCSAFNHVDQAESHPHLAYAVNATGPENLGILGARFDMQVVHISTDYVFGGEKKSPYLETDRCAPKNIYGKSKREGEEKLLSVLPSACVVRTSWLFGKGGINFISKLPVLFKNQEEIEVDDTCIGRPTFCMDLSRALLELLQRSGIFHYAGGKPSSRYEIATEMLEMAQILKLPIKCRAIKRAAQSIFTVPRPEYSALDTNHVESILNYRPLPWKKALQEFLKDG